MVSYVERVTGQYEDLRDRFRVSNGEKTYTQQYSHVYASRLSALKGELLEVAKKRWPEKKVLDRIVDAVEGAQPGEVMAIVGMVFKEQKRPDVLAEYRSEILHSDEADEEAEFGGGGGIEPASYSPYYAQENDAICVEDESGRVKVSSGLPVARMVTGVCVTICGHFLSSGDFLVTDYCGPGLPPPPADDQTLLPSKILLLSGLRSERFGLLIDWLGGVLSSENVAATISRCFVVGDLVDKRKPLAPADENGPVRETDIALARLAACVGTDAIPGESDPTTYLLPQQPLHPLLLPNAACYANTFLPAPNPHEAKVDGKLVLGHAGQPVHDILKHADYQDNDARDDKSSRKMPDGATFQERTGQADDTFLSALEDTLWWRVLAPTAPDSLASYPFTTHDPFVIDECPHVLFAAGAPAFATSLARRPDGFKAARIVALPNFAHTGVAALVDLESLDVERLHFDTNRMRSDAATAGGAKNRKIMPD